MLNVQQGVTLAIYAGVAVLAVTIGRWHATRPISEPHARRAGRLFALYWLSLAAQSGVAGAGLLAAATVGVPPGATLAFLVLTFAALAASMTGLVCYLGFLYAGLHRSVKWVASLYGAVAVASFALSVALGPQDLHTTRWGAQIGYARPPTPLLSLLVSVAFLLPPVAGALAYGALALRVRDPTARWRIGLVATGIFVWFTAGIALSPRALADNDAAQLLARALPLAGLLLVVVAYRPPRWAQRRWGIEPLLEGAAPPAGDPAARRRRDEELLARVHELV